MHDLDIVVRVMTEKVVLEPLLFCRDCVPRIVMLPVRDRFRLSRYHNMLMDILMDHVHVVMWHLMGYGHMVGEGNRHLSDIVFMDVMMYRHLSDVVFMVGMGNRHLSDVVFMVCMGNRHLSDVVFMDVMMYRHLSDIVLMVGVGNRHLSDIVFLIVIKYSRWHFSDIVMVIFMVNDRMGSWL